MLFALPAPTAPIPHDPAAIVSRLQQTERALDAAIDRWDKTKAPPRAVTLLALYEQRVIRLLAAEPQLARRVLSRDPRLRDDVTARRELGALTAAGPLPRAKAKLGRPPPVQRLLGWYREAQRRFGVRWQLLAAVNFVESAFGKVRNVSGAGAQGPMQFEPATWRAYGLGGRIDDPHDAVLGAAHYLAANHGRSDERAALYHYNHSTRYVDAVLRYTRRIADDPRALFGYYSWQVYFRTPTGDRRVTGPR
jgi:membrane-bound lytic murein transglycosylase B